MSDVVVCKSTRFGEGCGHPTADHVGEAKAPNSECCCCTRRHNDPSHVEGCLDCSIVHGKWQVRTRSGKQTPLVSDVEPYIPEPLKQAFWQRYLGKYFDRALGA